MRVRRFVGSGAVLAAMVLIASGAWAQHDRSRKRKVRKGRVVSVDRTYEGRIVTESWKEVVIEISRGNTVRIAAEDVVSVLYGDAPDAFRGALERVGANDYASALVSLGSAQEWVRKGNRVGPWFEAYVLYYKGLCQLRSDRPKIAVNMLADYLIKYARNYHMTRRALNLAFEALKKTKDTAKAESLANVSLPAALKPYAQLNLAQFLLDVGKASEAVKKFEELQLSSGVQEVMNHALVGIVRCYEELGDTASLEKKCREIIQTNQNREALFLAKSTLGIKAFEQKDYLKAVRLLSESIVLHHPNGMEKEHEATLWTLAQAYEALGQKAEERDVKRRFLIMANRTYYELLAAHRKGRYSGEARSRADELDKRIEQLSGGAGGEPGAKEE